MEPQFGQMALLHVRMRELAALARAEDLGEAGDITSLLLGEDTRTGEYRLVGREKGVLAGCPVAGELLGGFDRRIELTWAPGMADGSPIEAGTELARILGPSGSILTAERTLLNFLQRLCGVATLTRTFVDAVAGTDAQIYDTRKTIPGWRVLDKYAVHCGGGRNHRMGLHDAILIKDNHLAGIEVGGIGAALFEALNQAALLVPPPKFFEVEADSLEQAEQIFKVVGVDVVLLDNFTPARLRKAVKLRNSLGLKGKVQLEASGGVTLDAVRAIAETGVEHISVGALTHSAQALDLALEAG